MSLYFRFITVVLYHFWLTVQTPLMYERDLHNPDNEDTLISVPPLVENKEEKVDGFRSRVTRNATESLEIDIPREGLTCCSRFCLAFFFGLIFVLILFQVVLLQIQIQQNGALAFPLLVFVVVPGLIILCIPSCIMNTSFIHVNVTITRDSYSLTQRGITWKSCFQITCLPSHFNDLESGQYIETTIEESCHVRPSTLQAQMVTHVERRHYTDVENRGDREIVTHRTEYSEWKDIKLGSISFARGLVAEELEWLVEEINSFIRETN